MLGKKLKARAFELGFELAGVASADDPTLGQAVERYSNWLDQGFGATMSYLERHLDQKSSPRKLLEECRSVFCVGLLYGVEEPQRKSPGALVSKYTRGRDYHEVMTEKLTELSTWLEREHGVRSKIFVDSAPVFDRFWAWRAGLGWIGKNSMVINRKLGSFFFIGGLLTTAELERDEPGIDHCGRCTKCVDACPTAAILPDRVIDSARCIGYHTIENKLEVPLQIAQKSDRWIAGCDICQDVCPWNDPITIGKSFLHENVAFNADLRELARWTPEQFKNSMKNIAMGRMKYSGFARNLAIAISNSDLSVYEKKEAYSQLDANLRKSPESASRDAALQILHQIEIVSPQ